MIKSLDKLDYEDTTGLMNINFNFPYLFYFYQRNPKK
jgi:hypothetical protein